MKDGSNANRDLKFVDAVLADMRQKFRIDDSKIFATGFSNGARFVYLLWATRSKKFAAFAAVAGTVYGTNRPKDPKPIILVGGREDRQVEFRLQMESLEIARGVDGATEPAEACGTGCSLYRSSIGAPVISVVHPAGHVYPSFATDAIVSFFRSRS